MRRPDLELVVCKLRLLQFGLIDAAHYLDDISPDTPGIQVDDEPLSDGEETSLAEKVTRMRQVYTQRALKTHKSSTAEMRKGKHEGASEARREVLKNFLKDITKGRICASCKAISPSYRKDRFVKIFEKPLNAKDEAKMAQGSFRIKDALALRQKAKNCATNVVREL